MNFLQIALIFLILFLSVFLIFTGIQLFFILRDFKKALDRLNKIIEPGQEIDIKASKNINKKEKKPKSKRFYKKVL